MNPNDPAEAYTGNHIDRRGDRTPRSLIQPRKAWMQMAMVLTCQKPIQRDREGEIPEGLPGSTKSAVCVERSVENLGDPSGSWGHPGRRLREERRGPLGSQIHW